MELTIEDRSAVTRHLARVVNRPANSKPARQAIRDAEVPHSGPVPQEGVSSQRPR